MQWPTVGCRLPTRVRLWLFEREVRRDYTWRPCGREPSRHTYRTAVCYSETKHTEQRNASSKTKRNAISSWILLFGDKKPQHNASSENQTNAHIPPSIPVFSRPFEANTRTSPTPSRAKEATIENHCALNSRCCRHFVLVKNTIPFITY